jgi:16S rRNA (adenine1518-N6/adenine1519-N6)-dimethyltransferase
MNVHKQSVRQRLKTLDVRPTKQRGQNFVLDESVSRAIAATCGPLDEYDVVEIGPGLGALTKHLLAARSLTVVEIEEAFCSELAAQYPHVKIIHGDAREIDYRQLGKKLTVFGNLPYVFSTEIIFKVIESRSALRTAVFLLQKEFAERMAAPPGSRTYGVLSVMIQMVADVELGIVVPGTSFHPQANVDSCVVRVTFPEVAKVSVQDMNQFRKVVRAAFHQRRKMIHNSLKSSGKVPKELVDQALQELSLDPSRRAETFSLEEFARLSDWFSSAL